jgi:hypothetical protein
VKIVFSHFEFLLGGIYLIFRGRFSSTAKNLATHEKGTLSLLPPAPTPTIKVNVSVNPTEINEGETAAYTVIASSTVTGPITVNYSMSGTATNGTDYALSDRPNQVRIPAGQSSATVTDVAA